MMVEQIPEDKVRQWMNLLAAMTDDERKQWQHQSAAQIRALAREDGRNFDNIPDEKLVTLVIQRLRAIGALPALDS